MITALYTAILGIVFVIISIDVIWGRISKRISLGAGKNNEILRLVSSHDNFAAYTPLFIISLYFLESFDPSKLCVHFFGVLYTLGRVFHYLGVTRQRKSFVLRRSGMLITLLSLLAIDGIIIFKFLKL